MQNRKCIVITFYYIIYLKHHAHHYYGMRSFEYISGEGGENLNFIELELSVCELFGGSLKCFWVLVQKFCMESKKEIKIELLTIFVNLGFEPDFLYF